MKNWILRRKKLLMIFSIILVLMIVIIFSFVKKGENSQFGSIIGNGVSTLQAPIAYFGNNISDELSSAFSFWYANKENKLLKEEIATLKREIVGLQLDASELAELRELKNALNYKTINTTYNYATANVIAMDNSDIFNIFTINVGLNDGVEFNSIVVNGDGLIGRVFNVGDNWAKVISVIDESNSVSFRVSRDVNILGVLSGDGNGSLNGYMLDSKATVIHGDVLITSGLGDYPVGIIIGNVTDSKLENDQLIKTVIVEPIVDFKNIQKVTVITKK
jgi:rod shape-determining protein MreC